MKKRILFLSALLCSSFTSVAFADDVSLKRGCLKDNPLVVGENDAALLQIYAQACDKKNKDTRSGYLAQAAQRFQQIGKNYKALQLVNELNASNVQHSSLTDVKFLAGIGIANEALTQIRGPEVRYLTDETYAPAIALSDAVKKAKPLSVIETVVEEPAKRVTRVVAPPVKRTTNTTRNTKRPPARTTNTAPKPAEQPKRENPFGSL